MYAHVAVANSGMAGFPIHEEKDKIRLLAEVRLEGWECPLALNSFSGTLHLVVFESKLLGHAVPLYPWLST